MGRKRFWVGILLFVLGIGFLAVRVWFYYIGVLYGTSPITEVDVFVGALIVIGIACIAADKSASARNPPKILPAQNKSGPNGTPGSADGAHTVGNVGTDPANSTATAAGTDPADTDGPQWTNWASGAASLAGAGALVVSLLNIFQPANPPNLTMPACPGTRVNDVAYIGTTSIGVNSRQGPARSFLPNGRYPGNCSIGFSAYCVGDPIGDTGGTNTEVWVTSRWLQVAKQTSSPWTRFAHLLSGEKSGPAFISDAFIYPGTAYDQLELAKKCPGDFPDPATAELQPFNAHTDILTASARYASNMGFAVWVPPNQGFVDGNSYLQIASSSSSAYNPGQASPAGSKSVLWDYADTLLAQFKPPRNSSTPSLGHVTVMAIPCLAPNIPAQTSTAAFAGYQVSDGKPSIKGSAITQGANADQLARAACEAAS